MHKVPFITVISLFLSNSTFCMHKKYLQELVLTALAAFEYAALGVSVTYKLKVSNVKN